MHYHELLEHLPEAGRSSTVNDRFQEWQRAGLFEALWKAGLIEYDIKKKLNGRVWMER
jgi:transposase